MQILYNVRVDPGKTTLVDHMLSQAGTFREKQRLQELAPFGGNAAPDFVAAKLVYKMVGYRWAASRPAGS